MANKPTEKEILNSLQDLYDILVQLIEKGIVVKSDEYLNMRLRIATQNTTIFPKGRIIPSGNNFVENFYIFVVIRFNL